MHTVNMNNIIRLKRLSEMVAAVAAKKQEKQLILDIRKVELNRILSLRS